MNTENKKKFKQVCEYLGSDLDSEPCQKLRDHLDECECCEVYLNKIKNTIKLYRKADKCEQMPQSVSRKLFATLDLDPPEDNSEN